MPGSAQRRIPGDKFTKKPDLTPDEKSAIEILGIHRAAARGGLCINGGTLPTWLFSELHKLENSCKALKIRNKYVWDTMKRFGEYLTEILGPEVLGCINRSSHLIAFTGFPIGLAIMPDTNDPLCCVKPISYRPLTPLTRTLQMELPHKWEHYIGRGFKVVIAECLSPNDRIRPLSDVAWHLVRDMFKMNPSVNLIYSDVQSVTALKYLLKEHRDADILIISAHGSYDSRGNFAGLFIGDRIWLATDDDVEVPPIVILSACHVAPRGLGAVTVNDLLLRQGAYVVLGTLIPVDVRRNAILITRLFTYILEAIEGRGKFRSLDQAWQFVVATNAVHEILASSKKLEKWAHTRLPGKLSPIEEFKLIGSAGRLRRGHIYSDTFKILSDIAEKDGRRPHLEAVRSATGFFPESCFYVLTGSPENVILCEPVFEKSIDMGIK